MACCERITLVGALFLGIVAILPFLVRPLGGHQTQMLITSTGLLIVVGVVLDTMKQLEAQLLMRHYEGFIRKMRLVAHGRYRSCLGAPGAGKGTQAELLSEWLPCAAGVERRSVSRRRWRTGTELGVRAKTYMDEGELVPDDVTVAMVAERLRKPDCAAGRDPGWLSAHGGAG